jgi:hypothetical protein
MASFEHDKDPLGPIESLMNRSAMTGRSLQSMLHSGFYGPIKAGLLPGRMAELQRNPAQLARYNAAIDAALNGSNILAGATDQGSPSDPNGQNPSGRIIRFGEVYNDWTPQAAAWRRAQQQRVRAQMQGAL